MNHLQRAASGSPGSSPFVLSLVLPFFNEKKRIDHHLQTLFAFLSKVSHWQIVYIDDGSSDDSLRELKQKVEVLKPKVQEQNIQFIFLQNPINLGKGGAVRTGVLRAEGQFVLYTDFDFSISLQEVDKFLQAIQSLPEQKGIVIASRLESEAVLKNQSLLRKWMGRIFNHLMKLILYMPFKDTQCGFKLFDKESAQKLFRDLQIQRFAFDVEILKKALLWKIPVVERGVEIHFHDRQTTVNIYTDPFKMLWDLIKLRFQLRRVK